MSDECEIFTGRLNEQGYGALDVPRSGPGRKYEIALAHRLAWEREHGQPVPEGYHIHHICEVRACVKVSHLAAVTDAEHKAIHRETGHAKKHPDHEPDWVVNKAGQREWLRCTVCSRQSRDRGRDETNRRRREDYANNIEERRAEIRAWKAANKELLAQRRRERRKRKKAEANAR